MPTGGIAERGLDGARVRDDRVARHVRGELSHKANALLDRSRQQNKVGIPDSFRKRAFRARDGTAFQGRFEHLGSVESTDVQIRSVPPNGQSE